jgi:hypothetical protein
VGAAARGAFRSLAAQLGPERFATVAATVPPELRADLCA